MLLVLRDHKITLFQAKEEELVREIEERDIRIEDLEVRMPLWNYMCLLIHDAGYARKI